MFGLLVIWAAWRLIRRLLALGLIAVAVALAAGALHFSGGLEHRGAGLTRRLEHAARPLITDAQRAIERELAPARGDRRR